MRDEKKTKAELIVEMRLLRERVVELEVLEAGDGHLGAELRYRSLLANMKDMVFLLSTGGSFTFVSPQAATITGYESDYWLGKSYRDLIPAEHISLVQNKLALAAGGHKVDPLEITFLHARGHRVDVELSLTDLWDESEEVTQIQGIVKDVSERKRAEDELRRSHTNMKAMIENTEDCILLSDKDGYPVMFNSAYARTIKNLLGIDMKPGLQPHKLLPDEAAVRQWDDLHRRVLSGEKFTVEYSHSLGENDRLTFEHSFHPVFEGDEVVGFSEFTRDITELRRASEKMKEDLEGLVEERTIELTTVNERLQIGIDERKRADRALRDSEEKFRTLYESSSDAVMMLDEEGFIDCNDATLKIFGCTTREEFCGKHPSDLSPPIQPDGTDSMTLANEKIASAMNQGSAFFEWTHRRADGEDFPAEVLLSRMELGGRRVLQATVRDITERKRAEEALLESEGRFRSLSDATFEGIVISHKGRVVDANRAFIEIFGYRLEELVGQEIQMLVAPEDREFVTNKIRSGYEEPYEHKALHRDGSIIEVDIHGRKFLHEGRQSRITAIRDITERKQSEESLRLNTTIMDNVAEGIYLIGLDDLRIKWTNERFARMFGYDPGEMIGKHVDIVNAPAKRTPAETRTSIVDVLMETGEWHGEVGNIKRDGTCFWCHANVSLFDHPEYGKVIISVHTDITERKRAEEALHEAQQHLHAVIETLPIILWAVNNDGLITLAAGHGLGLMGLKPDQIIGQPAVRLYGDFSDAVSRVRKGLAEKAEAQTEVGGRAWDSICFRDRGEDGEARGILGVTLDVTERKETEKALKEVTAAEQQRIRHDLHDGVGQALTGLLSMAKSLEKKLQARQLPEPETMHMFLNGIQRAFADVDAAIKGLGPVDSDPSGLMLALEQLATTTKEQCDIEVRYECVQPVLVEDNEIATHLFRIAQEAVNNAVKHARPERIVISLADANGLIVISVCDDGHGFDVQKEQTSGMGLRIMLHRANAVGADLKVELEDAGGVRITCSLTAPADPAGETSNE